MSLRTQACKAIAIAVRKMYFVVLDIIETEFKKIQTVVYRCTLKPMPMSRIFSFQFMLVAVLPPV